MNSFKTGEAEIETEAVAVLDTGALTMKNIVFTLLSSISAVLLIVQSANAYATDWNAAPDPSATLLETVKKEAAESDVYQPMCAYFCRSYDVSFSQYLPYYRLKAKIAQATEAEIDECVREFDKLNTKEQAYVLTALFIYERIRRRPMVTDEEWKLAKETIIGGYDKKAGLGFTWSQFQLLRTLTSNYNISRTQLWQEIKVFDWFPYRPLACTEVDFDFDRRFQLIGFKVNEQRMFLLPPCEFPPEAPEGVVNESVWRQRVNVIKKCAYSSEIAFPAFHPEETDDTTLRESTERKDSKLYAKWSSDLKICFQFIDVSVHLKITPEIFERAGELENLGKGANVSYGGTLPYSIEEFLRRTDKKEQTSTLDTSGLAAIREYLIVWQSSSGIYRVRPQLTQAHPYGNSSVEPKTLGEIARFLLEGRIQYDRPFFDRELLKR